MGARLWKFFYPYRKDEGVKLEQTPSNLITKRCWLIPRLDESCKATPKLCMKIITLTAILGDLLLKQLKVAQKLISYSSARFCSTTTWTYIGLSDDQQESDFRWLNNAPLYYNSWGSSDPNAKNTGNCGVLSGNNLYDIHCTAVCPHLCSTGGKC